MTLKARVATLVTEGKRRDIAKLRRRLRLKLIRKRAAARRKAWMV